MSPNTAWLTVYVTSSILSNIGHGLIIAVVGPTQPYLAKNVDVHIDTINFVWTFGFIGYLIASLFTGFLFREYIRSEKQKLSFLTLTIGSSGILLCVVPFVRNFGLLVTLRMVQNFLLGAYITSDSSMMVFTMGPVKSRPFTNALHAAVGVGFFLSSFIVRPFLPEDATSTKDRNVVCNLKQNQTGLEEVRGVDLDADDVGANIAAPFIIAGLFCAIASLGYFILGFLPMQMPRFYEDNLDTRSGSEEKLPNQSNLKHKVFLLVFVFIFYFNSCGIERINQSMAYTFGYCGPLKLPSSEAVLVDSTYNGGFLIGRLASIGVVLFLKPRNMIITSCFSCVTAAIILCAIGGVSKYGLYVGTALLGFFVSWQFGSCYSFVAKKVDITGRLSSLFFIGCGLGSAAFPPLSGYVFTSSWGASSILYLCLLVTITQACIFAIIWTLARFKNTTSTDFDLKEMMCSNQKNMKNDSEDIIRTET